MTSALVASLRDPVRSLWPLAGVDPLNKIVMTILVLLPGIVLARWQVEVVIIALFAVAAAGAGVIRAFIRLYWKLAILLGAFFFGVRAVFLPGENVLFSFGPIRITGEGVEEGIQMAALMLAVGAGIVFLVSAVPARDLAASLQRRGVPHAAGFVLLSTIQSVTDLGRGVTRILDAQRARGIETEGNVLVRVRAFVPTLAPLFLGAIVAAEERAMAMDARGFSAPGRTTALRELPAVPWGEWAALAACFVASTAVIVWGVVS
jgi:energy-coupling factor transport system permease protein